MKRFKSLSIYAFAIFFNAAVSFATFSLLTHYLSEVDYGVINLYNALVVSLTPFIASGVPFVLSVDFFKMSQQEFRSHFTNALLIPVVFTVLFTLVFLIFHTDLQKVSGTNFLFTLLLPFTCLMIVLSEIFQYLFRNRQQPFLFAGYLIGKNILEVGFTVLLVLVLSYGWEGRIGGNIIALLASSLFLLFIIFKWRLYTGLFDGKMIYSILVAGLPFVPERLSIFVLNYSDRFFINHYRGTSEVGYYGAGAQVAAIMGLFIITLNNTFYPSFFSELSLEQINYKKLKKFLLLFVGLSAIATLFVVMITPTLFRYFIGPNFQPGKMYAVNLTLALFFWAIYNAFIVFLLNLKKNKLIMGISIFGVLLSLAANFFNVRYFGPIGATYTSLLVYFAMAGITVYYVHRFYNLRKISA
jgi:O-antigen/teichoic acid export membrane protein